MSVNFQTMTRAMGTYGQLKARFDGNQVLSNEQLRQIAPSIFAEGAHESRSQRYAYIPTVNVLDAMREEGFLPVAAMQSKSKIPGKADFTKHLIRFRHSGNITVGDVLPEVVLVNSHDGTSSYHLFSGLFRAACLNGLVVSVSELDEVKVSHSGKVVDRVIEGSFRVIDQSVVAQERVGAWRAVGLDAGEQVAFAKAAAALRFDAETQPVAPQSLLRVRRQEDTGNDLWTVFNRTQEALIRGGDRYITPTNRRVSTRPVNSIDKSVGLNQALWTLGAEMAKLKAG